MSVQTVSQLFAWLNRNSGAIQALGSVVAVGVTVFLARLTAKYVALTSTIAHSTKVQSDSITELRREAKASAAKSLQAHALRLGDIVSFLPKKNPPQNVLRNFNLLSEADVAELQRLTQVAGGDAHRDTNRAITALRWLLGLVERVQKRGTSTGYVLTETDERDYEASIRTLVESLKGIRTAVVPVIAESGGSPLDTLAGRPRDE